MSARNYRISISYFGHRINVGIKKKTEEVLEKYCRK